MSYYIHFVYGFFLEESIILNDEFTFILFMFFSDLIYFVLYMHFIWKAEVAWFRLIFKSFYFKLYRLLLKKTTLLIKFLPSSLISSILFCSSIFKFWSLILNIIEFFSLLSTSILFFSSILNSSSWPLLSSCIYYILKANYFHNNILFKVYANIIQNLIIDIRFLWFRTNLI